MDATKLRYGNWDELIEYCTYSAMPVGRYVLDVHGESRVTWPANDALCAALQIINHLQDCAGTIAILTASTSRSICSPLDGVSARPWVHRLSPPLRSYLRRLADRTGTLLRDSTSLPGGVNDLRLRSKSR